MEKEDSRMLVGVDSPFKKQHPQYPMSIEFQETPHVWEFSKIWSKCKVSMLGLQLNQMWQVREVKGYDSSERSHFLFELELSWNPEKSNGILRTTIHQEALSYLLQPVN